MRHEESFVAYLKCTDQNRRAHWTQSFRPTAVQTLRNLYLQNEKPVFLLRKAHFPHRRSPKNDAYHGIRYAGSMCCLVCSNCLDLPLHNCIFLVYDTARLPGREDTRVGRAATCTTRVYSCYRHKHQTKLTHIHETTEAMKYHFQTSYSHVSRAARSISLRLSRARGLPRRRDNTGPRAYPPLYGCRICPPTCSSSVQPHLTPCFSTWPTPSATYQQLRWYGSSLRQLQRFIHG